MKKKLTQAIVRELLDYDPETGVLTWKVRERKWFLTNNAFRTWNTRFAGKPAFSTVRPPGYFAGSLLGCDVYAHRVIFLWMMGRSPKQVDHDDGNKLNNRWANLNVANFRINRRNMPLKSDNKSGHVGVSFDQRTKKWNAFINVSGKPARLGRFASKDEAIARRQAASLAHGYNPNHGRNIS